MVKLPKINSCYKNQLLSVICVNIISLSHGFVQSWTSPVIPFLQSDESPLTSGPITIEEASWIGSLSCVGGLTGNFMYAYIADKFGRKKAILGLALPQIMFWLCVIYAKTVYHLYVGRILAGLCGGGLYVIITIYTTEIAQDKIRGSLCSMLILTMNTGILLGYILGRYFVYYTFPWIVIGLPVIFLLGFSFVPETPIWLMKHKRIKEAELSLRFYRGIRSDAIEIPKEFNEELGKLKHFADFKTVLETKENDLHFRDFVTPGARKGFIIGIALMTLYQFSGCFTFVSYSASIFQAAEAGQTSNSKYTLHPNDSTIVIGVIQLVGSYIATILADRAGRKVLMIVSSFGSCIGSASLGTYSYLQLHGYDLSFIAWVPIVSLSFSILLASIGILCLNFVIVGEVMPQKIRGIGTTICLCILSIEAFTALKVFPVILEIVHLYGCMWLFASTCFLGGLFVIFVVPETKGKSLHTEESSNN